MKLYFDNRMLFVDDDEKTIVYSPYTHSMVKVSSQFSPLLKKIVGTGSGVEFELKSIIGDLDLNRVNDVLDCLQKQKIFSLIESDYIDRNFNLQYSKLKSEVKITMAYLHFTQRCNLNCFYCYNKDVLNEPDKLDTTECIDIINKLSAEGVYNFIFTGGEPLIRDDILEIMRAAKSQGNVQVLTNGTLLHTMPDLFYELIDNIIISLDSIDPEVNILNRNNSDKYNINSNLTNIPKKYAEKIVVRSVITKNNCDKIDEIKDYVERILGFSYVTTLFLPNTTDEIDLMPKPVFDSESKDTIPYSVVNCGGCCKVLAIGSNGDVFPCQSLTKADFRITNMRQETWFQDLNESPITNEFKSLNVNNISTCKTCDYRYICGGGCRAIAYNLFNDISGHLDFFCSFLKQDSIFRLRCTKFKKHGEE